MPETVRAVIATALVSLDALQELGEEVEDEWTYVTDLADAWRDRLETLARKRGDETVDPAVEAAVDRACDEVSRISDPHRAIDWLSTFPQVIVVAFGERP